MAQRQHREIERKLRADAVLLLEYLLRRAQVADEGAEDQAGRDRVAQGDAVGAGLAQRLGDAPERERLAPRRGQRFRLADGEPGEGNQRQPQQQAEDGPPVGDHENALAEGRRQRRNQDEYRHHQRHDPGHGAALVLVADQGDDYDPRPGRAEALQHPAGQHGREPGREDRDQAADDEQGDAGEYRRLAADAVGYRAPDQLADGEAEEQRRDDHLRVVFVGDAEVAADRRQGRQHGVDG